DQMVVALRCADLTRYLRHYLVVYEPGITKAQVFPRFKSLVRDQRPDRVLTALADSATHYGVFVDPSTETSKEIKRLLTNLQSLRATICYSALLPAKRHLSEESFRRYLRASEILTFRYSSVCGKGSNDLELVYHQSAKKLEDSRGRELEAAIK